jgi:hypothetical protein
MGYRCDHQYQWPIVLKMSDEDAHIHSGIDPAGVGASMDLVRIGEAIGCS